MEAISGILSEVREHWQHTDGWRFAIGVLAVAIVLDQLVHWVFIWRVKRADPHRHVWQHAFLLALHVPARVLIWLLSLIALKRYYLPNGRVPELDAYYIPATHILAIVMVAWFFLRLVRHLKSNYEKFHAQVDYTLVDALTKLSWASVLVVAGLSIMQTLGLSPRGLLAFGGAAGIAVGFAAQNLVANLFGGLTILASDIFKIKEEIIIPGTSVQGEVQYIGWRSTRVLGWDGQPYYIPNSHFNTSTVINYSRMQHRQISEYLLLRYQDIDRVGAVVEQGNAWLKAHKDLSYALARFDSFSEGALMLLIYADVSSTDYEAFMKIKEQVLLQISHIARAHGCELIMPTSNLYLMEPSVQSLMAGRPAPPPSDRAAPGTPAPQPA